MKTIVAVALTIMAVHGATLTLTPAGISDGFILTTFATIDPGASGNVGPFGLGVAAGGNVLVSNYVNDTRYIFSDVDGRTTATALSAITPSGSSATAYATAGGQAYGAVNGQFVQFNSNGTVNHVLTGISQSPWFGMWGNPANGHILATTGQGQIIDINPGANGGTGSAKVVVATGLGYDGVTVSPDGAVVYVELNDHVNGYDISTGLKVFDSGLLSGGPDGIGVISSNNILNGDLVINFNGATVNAGFVGLLNPATKALSVIASGGTRGDYVAPDTTNGTLLLDYSDVVYRLACGPDCVIGGPAPTPTPTSGVPEPGTIAFVLPVLVAIVFRARLPRLRKF